MQIHAHSDAERLYKNLVRDISQFSKSTKFKHCGSNDKKPANVDRSIGHACSNCQWKPSPCGKCVCVCVCD